GYSRYKHLRGRSSSPSEFLSAIAQLIRQIVRLADPHPHRVLPRYTLNRRLDFLRRKPFVCASRRGARISCKHEHAHGMAQVLMPFSAPTVAVALRATRALRTAKRLQNRHLAIERAQLWTHAARDRLSLEFSPALR